MKVAVITNTFLPHFIGGRERYVYGLSASIKKLGHKVCIFTGANVPYPQEEEYNGIDVIKFPMLSINIPGHEEKIPYRIVCPSMFASLKKFAPDIVHANDYRHYTTDLASFYSRCANKALIMTIHGFFYQTSFISKYLLTGYDSLFGKFSLKIAKKIIIVSKKYLLNIPDKYRSKVVYIPNAISPCFENDVISLRTYLSIPPNVKIILAVGRVVKQKGFHILIKAFNEIQKILKNVSLVVIGPIVDKEYFSDLKAMIEGNENVIFTDAVSDALLHGAYNEADLIVIPSLQEGFPTVLLEAMSHNKPIIATSVGMIPEVLVDGINGLLVSPGKPKDLAEAIINLLTDDTCKIKLQEGTHLTCENNNWHNVAKQIIEVYEEALRK